MTAGPSFTSIVQEKARSVGWLVRLQMGSVHSRQRNDAPSSSMLGLCGGKDCCLFKTKRTKKRFQKQESKEAYEPSAVIATQEPEPPLVPLEGTRPSIVAASVASQWRQDSVKKEYKKQPLTEKPSVISFSDDSLLNEDTGHTYNLSEQSHEVLQQIIRCFPFPSAPEPVPKRSVVQRTASTDPNVLLSDHPGAKDISEAALISSLEAPPSTRVEPEARGWQARKRQLGAFLNRRTNLNSAEVAEKPDSSANLNSLCQNGEEKRGALGRLCQVSVDTMAITALPLDCWLKERLKNWVQLSGHEGTIVPASNHTLWKKQPANNNNEAEAYHKIMEDDHLRGLTPKFFKEMVHNNESFIEIQDLLSQFPNTSERAVMDIKIGTRTFLESEVANSTKRKDLYKKMIDIDPSAPTEEERQIEAITKLRYMQFREKESSTSSLGFRIEAAQSPGGKLQKSFKKVKTKAQVLETFNQFFGARQKNIKQDLSKRLKEMRSGIEKSDFFRSHEVVGSSILIIFDGVKASAWIIDFAKSTQIPDEMTLDHRTPWKLGNHEDGYLIGLDNLIEILDWEWS